jgi:hypothetical protein
MKTLCICDEIPTDEAVLRSRLRTADYWHERAVKAEEELEALKYQQWEPADGIWRVERTSHGRSSTLVAPLDAPENETIIRAVLEGHGDMAVKAIRGVYDRETFCPMMLKHEDHNGPCGVWPSADAIWSAIRDGLAQEMGSRECP